jgi:anti-anti-sigma factor
VQWVGRQAVVALPEHIDVYNAGPIREELLSVINRGAEALIVDMSATISCDHAGADAVVRASQRAALSGTKLRLVVTTRIVARVLSLSGLDRLVSSYPSLEAAMAADQRVPSRPDGRTDAEIPAAWRPDENGAVIPTAAVRKLVDALQDGMALADGEGAIALASRRLEEMFGYEHAELAGYLVESLVPAYQQAAHRSYWASYGKVPRTRRAGAEGRLAGLRKNGTTFPVEISLSPVMTTGGRFTMVVVRDITADTARAHIAAAVGYLDETIREVRDTAFTDRGYETAPSTAPDGGRPQGSRPSGPQALHEDVRCGPSGVRL